MIRYLGCSFHRNGVAGAGYYRVQFRCLEGGRALLTAIVFDAEEHVAIFDDAGNGYRYENHDKHLRAYVASEAGQRSAFPDSSRVAA